MNADSTKEESVEVQWTFREAAQVAEHLKRDLEIDRCLFTLGSWIHRGYDCQHPDVLPAAPKCGGNEARAEGWSAPKMACMEIRFLTRTALIKMVFPENGVILSEDPSPEDCRDDLIPGRGSTRVRRASGGFWRTP
jgi:hypothetical protein